MLKRIIFIFLANFIWAASVQANRLEPIQNLLAQHQSHALIGLEVYAPKSSQSLIQVNAFNTFHPASTTKLFTSFAALKNLGPNFQFKTQLHYKKSIKKKTLHSDVAIIFEGDPSLTLQDYKNLIFTLRQKGIQKIDGDFILDTSGFTGHVYAPGWTWEDFDWGYAPPVSGLSFENNALKFKITPALSLEKAAQISFESPSAVPVTITSKIVTVSHEQAKDCSFDIKQQANHFEFSGCWPIQTHSSYLSVANKDLHHFMAHVISHLLMQEGIALKGQVKFAKAQLPVQEVHLSQPLSELLNEILQHSNNLYAESLLKAMSFQKHGVGSFHEGSKIMTHTLMKEVGIPPHELSLKDGSGLSQYNLVSAHQINRLLQAFYHDEFFSIFKEGLSQSGQNGTLKKRLRSFDLNSNIFAKTGTLTGHSALAGYTLNHAGEPLIFSLLINNSTYSRKQLKSLEEQLLIAIKDLDT